MTGYGSGEAPLDQGRLVVEIRSVNHRFLDVRLRLASPLLDHAQVAEDVARRELERGRVELSARVEGESGQTVVLDRGRAQSAFEQLAALRDELRPDEPVPLSLLQTVPDLFVTTGRLPEQTVREALRTATEQACEGVARMREREGRALAGELEQHVQRVDAHVEALREHVPASVEAYRRKLRERIERLLRDQDVRLDSGRVEHEVALFADRVDVDEELARLAAHAHQFREIMNGGTGLLGRRLDFLLQEMAREANTVGSKTADAETAQQVVDLKAEVERMREQVQNVV
jgi:uncharacterized protein (TIGR00255 family)